MATASETKPTQHHKSLAVVIEGVKFDRLLLHSFSGTEGISRLFRFDLELFSLPNDYVKAEDVIGRKVVVRLAEMDKDIRYFIGLINRFSWTGRDLRFQHYHAEMVPWTWQLTLSSNCRIYQRKTVPDIIKDVFKQHNYQEGKHYKLKLQRQYTPWDYVVQYRETDFNFVSRLMEQEGIFYFYEHMHEKGGNGPPPDNLKDLMVLADDNSMCPGDHKVPYDPEAGYGEKPEDRIGTWHETSMLRPNAYRLRDYHFERSEATLDFPAVGEHKFPNSPKWEIFDYPGEYAQHFDKPDSDQSKVQKEGDTTAKLRMEEEQAPQCISGGTSNDRAFLAGSGFTLSDHPCDEFNKQYLLTSVHHAAETAPPFHSDGHHHVTSYHNSFTCMPFSIAFRPARVTPKPVIQGVQNARVVGSEGKEIEVDKWGRVKVQFKWDRYGKNDLDSSCWVRVAQTWAGKRWGTFFWPRIGQEVLVAFQEGDPEEPIIVGSAYNDAQPVPYLGDGFDQQHPDDFNLSGIKTNSTLGGKGYNELRFNDTKNKEQVFVHAQRDMDVRVRHDSRERIVHDRHLIVGWEKQDEDDPEATTKKGGDQREMVFQDKHLHVHRDQVEHIEGNQTQMVGKGEAENGGTVQIYIEKDKIQTIEGNYLMHVLQTLAAMIDGGVSVILNSDVKTLIKGANHLDVQGEQRQKVGGTQSLTVGQDMQQKVGQNYALAAGQEIHLQAGMTLVIEAGSALCLKGPGGFISIDPSGVTIEGTLVNINCGGSPVSGSGANPQLPDDPTSSKPKDAEQAKPTKPAQADASVSGYKSAPG